MLEEILAGNVPPRIVIGAHYHSYARETVEIEREGVLLRSTIYLCPSYCGLNHYSHKVTRSVHKITCGLLAFAVEDGEVTEKVFKRVTDLRTKETL